MPFDPKELSKYPIKPGVYLMKGKRGAILYVGKASNLRQRLRQYFVPGGDGRPIIPFLVPRIETIETIVVGSEKEALLLENNLIKKYKPRYNALLKDDKSYIALKLTRHEWPRVDLVRYRGKPERDGSYFGPYTNAGAARKTLDLLHRIFPIRQCSDPEFARRTRPCILYDMKRCIAPCVGYCTKEQYDTLVQRLVRFLQGKDKEVLQDLYAEMERRSEQLEFEKAAEIREQILQIEKTVETQHVDRPLGVDADVLGIFRQAEEVVLSQMDFRNGRLTGTRHYSFSNIGEDDSDLFNRFILQKYEKVEPLPKEILTPCDVSSSAVLEELFGFKIRTPKRGTKKKLTEMAAINAESFFKREKDEKAIREKILLEMQEVFRLVNFPRKIECFDTSNLSGTEPVASMAVFVNGQKEGASYRKYKVKTAAASDDYGAMHEVLMRRYKRGKEENSLPDLVIVDGGKGQLNVALRVFKELNIINVDVIGLAKEQARHDKGMTAEQVFLPNVKDPVVLKKTSPILFFLQKVRDEAHRFAVTFHRKRRSKGLIKSALEEVAGIGPAKRKRLLRHFGSLKKIKEAGLEQLQEVQGISANDAQAIKKHFNLGAKLR